MKPRVFCIADFYVPGYKAGGPIRTVENMVASLGNQIEFRIFTRDRDLGEHRPYQNVLINDWNRVDQAKVYYASPEQFGLKGVLRLLQSEEYNWIYINSFFSPQGAIFPLFAHKIFRQKRGAIILAPRGEFSKGALSIKSAKKWAYIKAARLTGLCRDIHWQASSQDEANDIINVFPEAEHNISIAPDLVSYAPKQGVSSARPDTRTDRLNVAFISRISPKKNLSYLLDVLSRIKSEISFSIFGPIEDGQYWNACKVKIGSLPSNISVEYAGTLLPDQVIETFARHDLFAFPTLGENFGHVIFESVRAGTPVLVSDQTPWRSDPSGAITTLPLADIDAWARTLDEFAQRDAAQQQAARNATIAYANRYLTDNDARSANLAMFERALAARQRLMNA